MIQPSKDDLFDCLDSHGQNYERLNVHDLSALLQSGRLTISDPVRIHGGPAQWVQLKTWFSPPAELPNPIPPTPVKSPITQPPAPAARSQRTLVICTAMISGAIIFAALLLRPQLAQPPLKTDPQRRSQLEEIVHLANREVRDEFRDEFSFNDAERFRPAVIAIGNFRVLNSVWLQQNTNILAAAVEAEAAFNQALDVIDGPLHTNDDYPIFRIHRDKGIRALLAAVNQL